MAFATLPAEAGEHSNSPLVPPGSATAFFLVTGLFFLWGIPNNLNDVLIRQFMKSFEITRLQAGLVTGLLLYSAGTLCFWPAALARSYTLFLVALFVIASGLGFLETGANPLIAQLGSPESAVRRLNFSQAFNPLGAISGVLIGTLFIFSGVELKAPQIAQMKLAGTYDAYLQHETMRVIAPYLVLGAVVLVWALFILRTPFPPVAGAQSGRESSGSQGSYRELLRYPHFLFAVFAQFCYVGAQVGTWSYFIQYVQDYTHLPEKTAGYLLTGTLAGFGVGRFGSSYWMKRVPANRLMALFAGANLVLVTVAILLPGWVGMWSIFLTSFFMSLMFPTIFALGLHGLGPNTKGGASLLVMAIIGGAVFTPVMGLVFQATHSMAQAMVVVLCCYIVVAVFAVKGSELAPRTR